jgi:DNA repair protein RadC
MDYLSIKKWASDDRPREKLQTKGLASLSDAELLAILIGTGTRETSAVELARQILATTGYNLGLLGKKSVNDLMQVKGIGEAKAVSIVAALELGRRRNKSESAGQFQLASSKNVFEYVSPFLADIPHEEFWVLYLNRSNRIIEHYKLSQGGISGTVTDIRLILKRALELLATSLIICHNHPSGNIQPSEQDKQITEKLKAAAIQMDLKLLDHLILADNLYYSFCDEGLL